MDFEKVNTVRIKESVRGNSTVFNCDLSPSWSKLLHHPNLFFKLDTLALDPGFSTCAWPAEDTCPTSWSVPLALRFNRHRRLYLYTYHTEESRIKQNRTRWGTINLHTTANLKASLTLQVYILAVTQILLTFREFTLNPIRFCRGFWDSKAKRNTCDAAAKPIVIINLVTSDGRSRI